MFRDAISGLDRILNAEIPQGSVVLITGGEGTLKSGLAFGLASNYLAARGEHGLYATLEQTEESHMQNMKSLGLSKSNGMHIFDYWDMRREWKNREPDLIKTTGEVIDFYEDKHEKMTVLVLDSLNALFYLSDESTIRKDMYHFFSELRDRGLTSFLIKESSTCAEGRLSTTKPENFLADGVIELGAIERTEGVKRFIRITKMRSAKHSMEKHQLVVEEDGLHILGPIY
ncbi:MAG: signal transduction protein [Methanotrichaceae archaeon]|nr:signal transduction protein [Methanotrichaceae archaeon]